MTKQFIRGAAATLLLAGGSLLFLGCSESQALESELNAVTGQALVQHPVDLSGTWKLNPDASDNPRELLGNRRGQGPRAGARPDSGARGVRRPGRPGAGRGSAGCAVTRIPPGTRDTAENRTSTCSAGRRAWP